MNTTEPHGAAAVEAYLARLRAELVALPVAERDDILLETRSHVAERITRSAALSVEEVLGELGAPEIYAKQFLPEEPARSVQRRSALRGMARLATGRWTSLPLLFVVVGAYGVALLAFLLALSKMAEFNATSLWTDIVDGHRRSVFLRISDPSLRPGHEVLRYWFIPIMLSITLSIHLVMSAVLRRFVRDEPSPRKTS